MLIIIKEVNAHLLLTQEVEQSAVAVQAAKAIKIIHRFYRNVFGLTLTA